MNATKRRPRPLASIICAIAGSLFQTLLAQGLQEPPPFDAGRPSHGAASATEIHSIPLFPPASDPVRQGFARVINRGADPVDVTIRAIDDGGFLRGTLGLKLAARNSVHFNSQDLEAGNPSLGLFGRAGTGNGNWRLEFESGADIEVLAYVRTQDGFLTSMHDLAPRTPDGLYVAAFNPAQNQNQRSSLRLMNTGRETEHVIIKGIDDEGLSPGGLVRLTLRYGTSKTLTAPAARRGRCGSRRIAG